MTSNDDRTPHRTAGRPIKLVKPRGVREKDTERDVNESVLGQLYDKKLIGECEVAAGVEYHKHLKKAAAGYGVPWVGRIPGQADHDADVMQCEAVIWLERINGKIEKRNPDRGRTLATVLSLALHPHSSMNLTEIDAALDLPDRKMRGRSLLIEALGEISEILGFATRNRHATKCG